MARTVCGHCKCEWRTSKEYTNRGRCDEPLCPNTYRESSNIPGIQEVDMKKVREAIDKAMEAANDQTQKPVNLHVVTPRKHHHGCICETCRAARRETKVTEVKILQPQAKIRVYSEETETESYYSAGSDTLYLEIPKIRVIKIIPQGGKKNKKGK